MDNHNARQYVQDIGREYRPNARINLDHRLRSNVTSFSRIPANTQEEEDLPAITSRGSD